MNADTITATIMNEKFQALPDETAKNLATIQILHGIHPHPDPEVTRIECAYINAWPVVISKGLHKEGELVIFIVIDSIVPNNDIFKFLEKQKFRVWNAKFKKAQSSGLVQPLSILGSEFLSLNSSLLVEGFDITTQLGIKKYERSIDPAMRGNAKGNFPSHLISISDEYNLLSYPKALNELVGKKIVISEKADGSSGTFIYQTNPNINGGEFKACSRRLELQEGSGFPWQASEKYDIKNKLVALNKNIAIQMEICGPKFNGNLMELKELEIRVFRAKDLDTNQIYGYYELKELCEKLQLPMVKTIDIIDFNPEVHTSEYFRNLADSLVWDSNGKAAEGLVVAPIVPFISDELGKFWSTKVINSNYK